MYTFYGTLFLRRRFRTSSMFHSVDIASLRVWLPEHDALLSTLSSAMHGHIITPVPSWRVAYFIHDVACNQGKSKVSTLLSIWSGGRRTFWMPVSPSECWDCATLNIPQSFLQLSSLFIIHSRPRYSMFVVENVLLN